MQALCNPLGRNKMNSILQRTVCVVLFAFSTAGYFGLAAAEKVNVKYTKNARVMYGEVKEQGSGGREIVRYFYVDQINKSEGFDFTEERGHNRDDSIEGNGTHTGPAVAVMKNGDEIYQNFSGSHKTTTKPDGAWEVNYQGVSTIVGGTGKYKNAKGKLNYTGRITETSLHEENVGEINY
jgi:hypothetical protein